MVVKTQPYFTYTKRVRTTMSESKMYIISNRRTLFRPKSGNLRVASYFGGPPNAQVSERKACNPSAGGEGELMLLRSPLVSGANVQYSSCSVYYKMAQASGETPHRASHRYPVSCIGVRG